MNHFYSNLKLFLVALFAFVGVGAWADSWEKTDPAALKSGDVVVIVDQTSSMAMSNGNGTSAAPVATYVEPSGDETELIGEIADNLQWVVTVTDGSYQFGVPDTDNYLYCTNTNNGVRVGTNANNAFTISDNEGVGFLLNTATSRYLGVYDKQDWRCYTSINDNIKGCVTAFYKKVAGVEDTRTATTVELGEYTATGEVGATIALPTATVKAGDEVVEGAAVVWSSSNEDVAKIEGGNINLLAAGTTTVKAIYAGNETYKESSKGFTLTVKAAPFTSLKALQEAVTATSTSVTIKLTDVVVTAVKGSNAYLADAEGYGVLVYQSGHGLEAGQVLNGTIDANLVLYRGQTEITNFSTEGLTITTTELVPTVKAIDAITAANQSTLVTLENVTYAGGKLSDGTNEITFYNTFGVAAEDLPVEGQAYTITGIVILYNATLEIAPRSAADIAEYVAPVVYVPEFDYDKYLIKNVGAGLYWGAGNDWGTQASLVVNPQYVKLVPQADENVYKLESQVNNGGEQYYFNNDGYMDGGIGVSVDLVITKLENGNYSIAKAADGTFYGYDGASSVLGKGLADAEAANAQWTIVSLDDAKAALSEATAEAPKDATLLIEDHNFGRNNRYVGKWTMEASNQNLSGGNNTNNCAESYHATFTLSQELAGAPAGVYSLTAQGYYRQDDGVTEDVPVFYINDETAEFFAKTGTEGSMSDASVSFTAGLYTITPIFVKVEEGGTLTIGAKGTATHQWVIWDNFVLTYYGDCDLAEAKFAGLIAQVKALKAEAEELVNSGNVSELTATALGEAIAAAAEIEATEEAYNAVVEALSAAVNQAKKDVDNKSAIDAAYALIESTNFYTAEALATYKAEADSYKEAWEAGTLTATVDNPATVHGWRAGNSYDNFLLSAWTINDVQADDFATALYINTWSLEGETDGTEFKVPFFEYWTGDAESLGAATLSAKVTDLEPGYYDVSAWVRVRAKNGVAPADATGITASVNGGAAVNVTEGAVVENSQFSLAEYKVRGKVGEDGVLTFSLNVEADNNISWLSFKNVKYTAVDALEVYYANALAAIEDGATYRVFTEVNGNKFYLNAAGSLVANPLKAFTFTFNAVNAAGTLYPTGWNLGQKFTNPSLTNGSSGDVVQNGHINVGGNDRIDWERQVFFQDEEGKFAVRATNANSANWGANTYWTVTNTDAELPNADYQLTPAYVWQIEANVDNRPEAFAKVQTWLSKLQAVEGLVQDASSFSSNAKEATEGSYEALLDGEYTTYFHSSWSKAADADHYLQAALPEATQEFYIYFQKRSQNNNNRPTDLVVSGSNDGENFTQITEITEGLPTGATPLDYLSAKISSDEAYSHLRFTVLATNNNATEGNGHKFFTYSEFYILRGNELTDAAVPFLKLADYTDLAYEDVETVNAIAAQIDAAYQIVLDAEEIAAIKAAIRDVCARGNELSQAQKEENIFAEADIEAHIAAITTLDEAKAGLQQVKDMVAEYIGELEFAGALDITKAVIVNPTPVDGTIDGWEGTKPGNKSDGVAEYWNQSAAGFKQSITLPAGDYKLTVVALQRTDMTGYVFAGETQKTIAQATTDDANNRAQAASWFAAGNGVNEVEFTLAEAGNIEIGLKADASTGDHWTVWQSFKLELVAPEAPAADVYEGVIEQTVSHPTMGDLGTSTEEQTVTISSVVDGKVNITFSGFKPPFPPTANATGEFTLEGVAVTEIEGGVAYALEGYKLTIGGSPTEGGMAAIVQTYQASLEGVHSTDGTPNLKLVLSTGMVNTIYFGADKDAIAAYKKLVGIRGIDAAGEKATTYDLSGRKVEKVQRGGVYIINGKKVSVK